MDTFLQVLQEKKDDIMGRFESVPGLDPRYRREGQKYIEGAYQTLTKPNDVKRVFIDSCNNRPGM